MPSLGTEEACCDHAATQTDGDAYAAPAAGLVMPQISSAAVEIPQVVGSFPLSEDFAAPVYNQVHQEQIVATVQPRVIVQEIPELPVVEWIQEQVAETIDVIPQEDVKQHPTNCALPVSQIQEQSAVTGSVNSQFPITAVEASQVVGSFSLSEEFAAPAEVTTLNTSSTSTSSAAPVYNRVRDAAETTQNTVEIPSSSSTSTSIDRLDEQLTNMLDMLSSYKDVFSLLAAEMENIEKETDRVAMLTKRMLEPPLMETPLPEPPMVEPPLVVSDRASAKRRRRTRYTPLLGIMENAVYLAPSAWPPTRRA